jgi:hypothetical protein
MNKLRLSMVVTIITALFVSSFSGALYAAPRQLTKAELDAMGIMFLSPGDGTEATGGTVLASSVAGTNACYELALPAISDTAALARAIDEYIEEQQPASPFIGLGTDMVAGGIRHGVNPLFMVGNIRMESSYGTAGSGGGNALEAQLHRAFNAFGRTAGSKQPNFVFTYASGNTRLWYKYPSWKNSVNDPSSSLTNTTDQPSLMRKVYLDDGLLTIGQYLARYAPATDGNDESTYAEVMRDVILEITQKAGSAITCQDSGSTVTPASTEGGA